MALKLFLKSFLADLSLHALFGIHFLMLGGLGLKLFHALHERSVYATER
jgi:hypothetical protein